MKLALQKVLTENNGGAGFFVGDKVMNEMI